MALDIADLAGKSATITVDIMGHPAVVQYDPTVITQEFIAGVDSMSNGFAGGFCTLVKGWDVTISKKKVPLTEAALKKVPSLVTRSIFIAIMREVAAGESGKASSDT